jgi:hypothetical protein
MDERRRSPIFVRTYDFLLWLVPHLLNFPRSQRGVMAQQLRHQAFALYDALVDAAVGPERDDPRRALRRADAALTKLRSYVRLSHDLELFSDGQYEHAARMLTEIGRLLGGWIKSRAGGG